MSIINAFTVDVEDYYQVSAFERDIDRSRWGQYEQRVVANTHRILEKLDERGVKATFFVLGWVASKDPQLVREIHEAGHEVGSHSFSHELVYHLSPAEFRRDLCRSRDLLEDITGEAVTCYRAPSFSITRRSLWALEILAEEGFRVDSSVYPIYHDRYGIPGSNPHLHQVETSSGRLWEFPLSVAHVAGLKFPVAGGGYFRLFPLAWTNHCLARINRATGKPFVFYIHPWELDPHQPRIQGRLSSRIRHYVGLKGTGRKLRSLAGAFRFGPMCDVIRSQREAHVAAGSKAEGSCPS